MDNNIQEDNNSNQNQITDLSTEEKLQIINQFQTDLKSIDLKQETIERVSSFAQDKIIKYGSSITPELFQVIDSESHFSPRLEYLYIINDLLQNLLQPSRDKENQPNQVLNEDKENQSTNINLTIEQKNNLIYQIFPYVKNICGYSYSTLNETFREKIRELLKLWESSKIFPTEWMKELNFQLNMLIEPKLSQDKDEENYLINLVNNGKIKIDQNLIDYTKVMEDLERTKDNKHRKNLLIMERDLIAKQMRIYSLHVQQLKKIDLILDKIKTFNEFENNSLNEDDNK